MAVQWGLVDRNQLKGQVRKKTTPRRERYIEDWELDEAVTVASPMLRSYIVLKLLTGLRRGDLLRLRTDNLLADGIHVHTSKTGKRLIIRWTEELREAVESALSVRPDDVSDWVFCTRRGDCYVKENGTANAFDSLWQRFMKRVLAKTKVKEKFQEKDLRKKTATDMPIESARRLLGHTSEQTTRRHYRLKGELVTPHSLTRPSQD
jgi:integrase